MFRIIIASTIFLCVSYFGFYYGESFSLRSNQLNEFLKGIILLNNEVIFNSTPLPEAFVNISYKVDSPVKDLVFDAICQLDTGKWNNIYQAFEVSYKEHKTEFALVDKDKKVLGDFLKSLGDSGVYGQEKIFNLTLENLKIICREAEESSKKNTKMYRTMGVCIGAMIGIFII